MPGRRNAGRRAARRRDDERQPATDADSLRRIVESLDIITWEADAETWRFLYVSPQAEDLLGYPAADWYSPTFWADHIHPDDRTRVVDECMTGAMTRERYELEYRMIHADGRVVWFRDAVTVTRDAAGRKLLSGFMEDVTERIRADEARARLAAIVESSQDAIVSKTLDGVIRSWNAGAEAIFGYGAGEAVGQPITLIIPPDRQDEEREIIARISRGERIEHFETVRRAKDGRLVDVSVAISPIRDSHGRVTGASKVARDVTARRRMEETLRESEERLRQLNDDLERKVAERTRELAAAQHKDRANLQRLKAIVSRLPMAAIAHDEHDAVIEVNELFCEAFGLDKKPSELVGTNFWHLKDHMREHLVDSEQTMAKVGEMLDKRETRLGEELRLVSGRILQRDYIPIYEDGEYHGQLFLYRDVTRERRVDASKSEFMSLASHQLRTPLTSIRWMLGRLGKTFAAKATPEERRLLEEGRDAASRMSQTIDTMLAISRIESGSLRPAFAPVNLPDVLMEAEREHLEERRRKKHSFRLDCPADARLSTDPRFLKEILGNLVGNAVKYTPEGGSVSIAATTDDAGTLIEVRDSGMGIPTHQQDRIFKKFFRGDNAIAQHTDGNGLGLYLAALMAGHIGGELTFRSEEGKGTVFSLRLPHSR